MSDPVPHQEQTFSVADEQINSKLEGQRARIDQQTKNKRISSFMIQPNATNCRSSSAQRKIQSETKPVATGKSALNSRTSHTDLEMRAVETVDRNKYLTAKLGACSLNEISEVESRSMIDSNSDDIHIKLTDFDRVVNGEDCYQQRIIQSKNMSDLNISSLESMPLPVAPAQKLPKISSAQSISQAAEGTVEIPTEVTSQVQNKEHVSQKLQVLSMKKNDEKKIVKQNTADELKIKDDYIHPVDLDAFILCPAPQGVTIKCRVTRDKRGMDPTYFLHLEESTGRKRQVEKGDTWREPLYAPCLSFSSPVLVCLTASGSNLLGTHFTLFDYGNNPKQCESPRVRQELVAVVYKTNVLGLKGPRKMTVILPGLIVENQNADNKPHEDCVGLIERWKRKDTENLIVLHNKMPVWNEDGQSHVLNFSGRVTQSSVKNFQIVPDNDGDYIVMQFGKVSEDVFTMDYSYPLHALQAFGIALSSFDGKLACE